MAFASILARNGNSNNNNNNNNNNNDNKYIHLERTTRATYYECFQGKNENEKMKFI